MSMSVMEIIESEIAFWRQGAYTLENLCRINALEQLKARVIVERAGDLRHEDKPDMSEYDNPILKDAYVYKPGRGG